LPKTESGANRPDRGFPVHPTSAAQLRLSSNVKASTEGSPNTALPSGKLVLIKPAYQINWPPRDHTVTGLNHLAVYRGLPFAAKWDFADYAANLGFYTAIEIIYKTSAERIHRHRMRAKIWPTVRRSIRS